MKKIVLMVMVFCVVGMVGCGKDDGGENGGDGGNGEVVKHNVELKYDGRTDEGCVHLAMDTIRKYNNDKNVDTIFLVPEPYDQFATWNSRQILDAVNYLRERHNVNPNKVFGKGDLKINTMVIEDNPEIVRFFADTLKYNVI